MCKRKKLVLDLMGLEEWLTFQAKTEKENHP